MSKVQLPQFVRLMADRARAPAGPISATLKSAAAKIKPASPDVYAARLSICKACPNYRAGPYEHCALCKCPLASRNFLERAHCPDNPPRW